MGALVPLLSISTFGNELLCLPAFVMNATNPLSAYLDRPRKSVSCSIQVSYHRDVDLMTCFPQSRHVHRFGKQMARYIKLQADSASKGSTACQK
jgi:hypothetical protein